MLFSSSNTVFWRAQNASNTLGVNFFIGILVTLLSLRVGFVIFSLTVVYLTIIQAPGYAATACRGRIGGQGPQTGASRKVREKSESLGCANRIVAMPHLELYPTSLGSKDTGMQYVHRCLVSICTKYIGPGGSCTCRHIR